MLKSRAESQAAAAAHADLARADDHGFAETFDDVITRLESQGSPLKKMRLRKIVSAAVRRPGAARIVFNPEVGEAAPAAAAVEFNEQRINLDIGTDHNGVTWDDIDDAGGWPSIQGRLRELGSSTFASHGFSEASAFIPEEWGPKKQRWLNPMTPSSERTRPEPVDLSDARVRDLVQGLEARAKIHKCSGLCDQRDTHGTRHRCLTRRTGLVRVDGSRTSRTTKKCRAWQRSWADTPAMGTYGWLVLQDLAAVTRY